MSATTIMSMIVVAELLINCNLFLHHQFGFRQQHSSKKKKTFDKQTNKQKKNVKDQAKLF